jgi:hypothetical protein
MGDDLARTTSAQEFSGIAAFRVNMHTRLPGILSSTSMYCPSIWRFSQMIPADVSARTSTFVHRPTVFDCVSVGIRTEDLYQNLDIHGTRIGVRIIARNTLR